MDDGIHFDDALLGLRGFRVTAVTDGGDELLVGIETIREAASCPACGVTARAKDRLCVRMSQVTPEQASPARLLDLARGHWEIENRVHRVRDWNFDEDRCQVRTGNGPRFETSRSGCCPLRGDEHDERGAGPRSLARVHELALSLVGC